MKKRKIKQIILLCLIILGITGIIYYTYSILSWKKDVDDNHKIIEKMEEAIEIVEEDNPEQEEKIQVDFNILKSQNSDTVAYLNVDNTRISYVVVKGKDNDYYLNHNFNKNKNVAGWIFADFHNKFDGSDKNIVIYGHNTSDGSMFGTLKNTSKSSWYNMENIITLVTEKEYSTYNVFSVYSIIPEDYYINTAFSSDEEYEEFLQVIKKRSIHNFNVDLDKDDQILTLSSCIENGTKRIVLHAKKVNSIIND